MVQNLYSILLKALYDMQSNLPYMLKTTYPKNFFLEGHFPL